MGLDTTVPYRYMHRDGSGRSIALFFYDGAISRAIAFEQAGASGDGFVDLFAAKATPTRGWSTRPPTARPTGTTTTFSELGLAYALFVEAPKRDLEVTNYAHFLADHPPEIEARLVPGGRTRGRAPTGSGDGKRTAAAAPAARSGWNQAWRGPLRAALEIVRDAPTKSSSAGGQALFADPWAARDAYVDVVIGAQELEPFLRTVASGPLTDAEAERAHTALELQSNSLCRCSRAVAGSSTTSGGSKRSRSCATPRGRWIFWKSSVNAGRATSSSPILKTPSATTPR